MKRIIIAVMTIITMSNFAIAQNGKAIKEQKTFKLVYTVSNTINADASKVWGILINGAAYPDWNSTIKSLEGEIKKGEKIELVSTVDESRKFKLKVKELEPNQFMKWGSGAAPMFKGVRIYTLKPTEDGKVIFTMSESLSGVMLPMIKGSLPDFRPSFEQFAADLKAASEKQ